MSKKQQIVSKLLEVYQKNKKLTVKDVFANVRKDDSAFTDVITELANQGILPDEIFDFIKSDDDSDKISLDELTDEDIKPSDIDMMRDFSKEIEEELMKEKVFDSSV
ncbi:MAG: hypothetical protein PHW21_04440, partial [Candidatus Izemoplasmatales bacterium]|nr:hypothetical protein [Candidatus Izemoplasmatales bacterium]